MHFTPVQTRMMDVLSDGQPHKRDELFECLDDDLASITTIRKHLSIIRKQLRTKGEDILCEYHARSFKYRHVILLKNTRDAPRNA